MRGADIRVECLLNGCMTWRWFRDWRRKVISRKKDMPRTGVGTAYLRWRAPVDLRKGESANVKRVGLDNRSADQKS